MKELKPNFVSDLIPLSTACQENLERSTNTSDFSTTNGQVFQDGKLSYLSRNSCLEVIYCEDGSRKASVDFTSIFGSCKVTSVLWRECLLKQRSQLIVGLQSNENGPSKGYVSIFDVERGKVLKSIAVPEQISSMELLFNDDNVSINKGLLSDLLEDFHGILAVGSVGGQMYLLDLQDDFKCEGSWQIGNAMVIKTREEVSCYKKERNSMEGRHCCISLTDAVCSTKAFQYVDPDSNPLCVFSSAEIFVSGLLHIRQCGLLVCGFSFGCFQLWDMSSLDLVYSSPLEYGLAGISHLLFQEPENDPRHCCYIWVGRGPLSSESTCEFPTSLCLYQLVFDLEKYVSGLGTVYQVLDGVCLRFEHQLTSDVFHLADSTSTGGRILCCHVLQRENKSMLTEKSDYEGPIKDSTLAYFVWEAPGQDTEVTATSCHLGIFDINRWYHMQLPLTVRDAAYGSRDVACPFFAFYALTDVMDLMAPDGIVDVYINADEIQMYSSNIIPRPEQYFWPSSLAFDCICLSERSLVKAEMLGIQRQILADIIKKGTNSFSEAHALFNMCWGAGLIPATFDISRPQDKQLHYEALLSVVLEHNAVLFVQSCISRWTAGDITFPGCSLRLVLNWAWKRIISTKEQLDLLYGILFDGYSTSLDSQYLKILDQCSLQMHHLVEIMETLQACPVPVTEEGSHDFKIKLKVAKYIQQYVDVLLILTDYGLLPISAKLNYESSLNSEGSTKLFYPASILSEYYLSRRDSARCDESLSLHIDHMSESLKQYISDFDMYSDLEWDGKYPPPSVNVLCRLFLMDLGEKEARRYFYYWALDLDECLGKTGDNRLASKALYKLSIPVGERDMTRGLWCIDHKLYAEGVKCFLECDSSGTTLKDVILTLFREGENSFALQLLLGAKVDYTDNKSVGIFMDILIQNGLLAEAYQIQSKLSPSQKGDFLFKYFLEKCYEYKVMNKIFQLPLVADEEVQLIDFLNGQQQQRAKDLLLSYYLQRGLHMEVFTLHNKSGRVLKPSMETACQQNTVTQHAITESYIKALPRIQQKLMSDPSLRSLLTMKQREHVQPPKPLSAVARTASKGLPRSRAGILHATLSSIEANSHLMEESAVPFKPFIGLPVTPKSSGLERVRPSSVVVPRKEKTESPAKGKHERPCKSTPQTDIPVKRRKHLYSGVDAFQLLKTPPVVKRPQVQQLLTTSLFTPPSILKTRSSSRVAKASGGTVTSDRTLVDGGGDRSFCGRSTDLTDTTRRRIRFALKSSPESDVSSAHDTSADPAHAETSRIRKSVFVPASSATEAKATSPISQSVEKIIIHRQSEDEQVDKQEKLILPGGFINIEDDSLKRNLEGEFGGSTNDQVLTTPAVDVAGDLKALDSGLDLEEEEDEDTLLDHATSKAHTDPTSLILELRDKDSDSDLELLSQSAPSEECRVDENALDIGSIQPSHSDMPSPLYEEVSAEPRSYNVETDDLTGDIEDVTTETSKESVMIHDADFSAPKDAALKSGHAHSAVGSGNKCVVIEEEEFCELHTTTEEIFIIHGDAITTDDNQKTGEEAAATDVGQGVGNLLGSNENDEFNEDSERKCKSETVDCLQKEDHFGVSDSKATETLGAEVEQRLLVVDRSPNLSHSSELIEEGEASSALETGVSPPASALGPLSSTASDPLLMVEVSDDRTLSPRENLEDLLTTEKDSISDRSLILGADKITDSAFGKDELELTSRISASRELSDIEESPSESPRDQNDPPPLYEPLLFDTESTPMNQTVIQQVVLPTTVLQAVPTPHPSVKGDRPASGSETPRRKHQTSSPKKKSPVRTPLSPSKQKRQDHFKTSFKIETDELVSPPLTRSASKKLSGTRKGPTSTRSSLPTYKVDSPLSFVTTASASASSTPNSTRRKTRRSLDTTPSHRMKLRSHAKTRSLPRVLQKN